VAGDSPHPVWVGVACIFVGLAAKDLFTAETGPVESVGESGGGAVGVAGGQAGITFLYCYS